MINEIRIGNWTFELYITQDLLEDEREVKEFLERPTVKNTLEYISSHQDEIKKLLIDVIRNDYDEAFRLYGKDEDIPEIDDNTELEELLTPTGVTLHPTVKDGYNYVGYGFDSEWQIEHGIGVMMHKNRVVQHGGEDHAFLEYMAEDDAKLNQ